MLNESNAHELAQVAKESGALVMRGPLQYPGPETGNWEIGAANIPDVLYRFRDRLALLILAPVKGGPVHLRGIFGFVLSKPGEPCPRCALINEDVVAALSSRRVADDVEDWLKARKQTHLLELELTRIQNMPDAMEAYPPL
jgi:hypothetical protein